MNTPLRFRGGHALHTMGAGFVLEMAVHPITGYQGDNLLVTAVIRGAFVDDFHLPVHDFGITAIHAEKIPGKQCGFFTAGARADFQHDILFIQRVGRKQQQLEALFQVGHLFFNVADFFLRHFSHIHVGIVQQRLVLRQLPVKLAIMAKQCDHLAQIGVSLGEFAITLLILISVRRGKLFFQLHIALFQIFQLGEHGHSLHILGRDHPSRLFQYGIGYGVHILGRVVPQCLAQCHHRDFQLIRIRFPCGQKLKQKTRRAQDTPRPGRSKPCGQTDQLIGQ